MDCDRTAELLRALGDPQRLRLLVLLTRYDTVCGCELEQITGIAQYTISRNLGRLRAAGLVTATRNAARVDYALRDNLPRESKELLAASVALVADDERVRADATAAQCLLAEAGRNRCSSLA